MSIERAQAHLSKYNASDRILVFDKSSATVELAAIAVGCEPARIAKTLSFAKDDSVILIVTSGDKKIDNQKIKLAYTDNCVCEFYYYKVGYTCSSKTFNHLLAIN